MAFFRVVSSAGTDLTVPTSNLSGVKTGTATASFTLPIGTVGAITFEVWLTDARGADSNRLTGTLQVLPRDTSGTWEKLGVSPPHQLYGIGWNGSMYVAVGANGTVMSSTNLTTWTVQTTGVTHTLRSVASSPSRFVAVGENAVGEGIILASPDGATWTVQFRAGACQGLSCGAPSMLSRVIWTGTQFVAVGQESPVGADTIYALVLTSPDGLTWTQRASRAIALDDASWLAMRHITSVAWSGTVLAMIGLDGVEPASWTSAAGSNWTRGTTPSEAVVLIPWGDIAWGNGRFVVVGGLGIGGAPTFTSTDGINWQVDSTFESLPPMNAVTAGDNEYIAVGDTHREWSADGAVWTATPMTDCGKDAVWDGARYVAVGSAICRSQ